MARSFFEQQRTQRQRSVLLVVFQFLLLTAVLSGLPAQIRQEVAR